jgi:hypothetical protein
MLAVVEFDDDSTMCELSSKAQNNFFVFPHRLEDTPVVLRTMNSVRSSVVPGLAFLGVQPDSVPWAVLASARHDSYDTDMQPSAKKRKIENQIALGPTKRQFVLGSFNLPDDCGGQCFTYTIDAIDMFGISEKKNGGCEKSDGSLSEGDELWPQTGYHILWQPSHVQNGKEIHIWQETTNRGDRSWKYQTCYVTICK